MQTLAVKAYGEAQHRTAGEKQIEFALFKQITQSLETASREGTSSPTAWADAVNRNQQMWTMMTADILHPQNALPEETKKSLLHVAEFVRQCSMQVLAGSDDIADLIEVNTIMMTGAADTGSATLNGEEV